MKNSKLSAEIDRRLDVAIEELISLDSAVKTITDLPAVRSLMKATFSVGLNASEEMQMQQAAGEFD